MLAAGVGQYIKTGRCSTGASAEPFFSLIRGASNLSAGTACCRFDARQCTEIESGALLLLNCQEAHFRREEEIQELRKNFVAGMEIGPEITEFLKSWLISHIMESDKHFGGYLEGRRVD